jgi:hypothetical protein
LIESSRKKIPRQKKIISKSLFFLDPNIFCTKSLVRIKFFYRVVVTAIGAKSIRFVLFFS